MVIFKQLGKVPLDTFGDLSNFLLGKIMSDASLVYFVTDQYIPGSVKTFERAQRSSTGVIRIRIERRDQARAKQWSKYLSNADNKEELVRFLLEDWEDETRFLKVLRGKTLYVNVGAKFFKITTSGEKVKIIFY